MALPAIVVVLSLGLGALAAGATTVRLQHAAAESARLFGRGDDERARTVVADVGGTVSVERDDTLVCVEASAPVSVPFPLVSLTARSCALGGGE